MLRDFNNPAIISFWCITRPTRFLLLMWLTVRSEDLAFGGAELTENLWFRTTRLILFQFRNWMLISLWGLMSKPCQVITMQNAEMIYASWKYWYVLVWGRIKWLQSSSRLRLCLISVSVCVSSFSAVWVEPANLMIAGFLYGCQLALTPWLGFSPQF